MNESERLLSALADWGKFITKRYKLTANQAIDLALKHKKIIWGFIGN